MVSVNSILIYLHLLISLRLDGVTATLEEDEEDFSEEMETELERKKAEIEEKLKEIRKRREKVAFGK